MIPLMVFANDNLLLLVDVGGHALLRHRVHGVNQFSQGHICLGTIEVRGVQINHLPVGIFVLHSQLLDFHVLHRGHRVCVTVKHNDMCACNHGVRLSTYLFF